MTRLLLATLLLAAVAAPAFACPWDKTATNDAQQQTTVASQPAADTTNTPPPPVPPAS